jgi:MGT family glycosyltransferase
MGRHIAVVNIPAIGHVYPTLAVVAELVRRGHRVSYTTIDARAAIVEAHGARALRYRSSRPSDSDPDIARPKRSGFISQSLLNFVIEAEATLDEVGPAFRDDPPDLIVFDRMAFAGRVLAAELGVPAIQLWPMLVSNEHWSMGVALDAFDPEDPVLAEYVKRLDTLLARHGLSIEPDQFLANDQRRQIAFYPKAFQYEGDKFDDAYEFVGPCVRARRSSPSWEPPDDSPVLLVTLGTIFNRNPDFYRACLAALAETAWHAVLVVGERTDPAELGPPPRNVEVHRFVPQLDVMAHARLLLCHAGMGGTMEALSFGVPVLAAPQTLEQEANAARIEELGLGGRVDPVRRRPDALRAELDRVANDPAIATAVAHMRGRIAAAGGTMRAADVIEAAC